MQITRASMAPAELTGFRIMGDAPAPSGRGVLIRASHAPLVESEVTGAAGTAIVVRGRRSFIIDASAPLPFTGNVFPHAGRDRIDDEARSGARAVASRDNWFVDDARFTLSAPPRIRRGR